MTTPRLWSTPPCTRPPERPSTSSRVDPDAPPRRVVLAVDVPDGSVRLVPARDRGAVDVLADVPVSAVAAAHVDEPEGAAVVARAASLVGSRGRR